MTFSSLNQPKVITELSLWLFLGILGWQGRDGPAEEAAHRAKIALNHMKIEIFVGFMLIVGSEKNSAAP